jgi:hypothetical protein
MARIRSLIPLLACCLLVGCGDDDHSLFSEGDATEAAGRFCRPIGDGNLDEALSVSGLPFRFRTRTWVDAAEVKTNLQHHLPWLQDQLRDAQDFEVFPYSRLAKGDWPRGNVQDLNLLGVQHDGFVVWIKKLGNQTAILLVLNPGPNRVRLVATGIDPS